MTQIITITLCFSLSGVSWSLADTHFYSEDYFPDELTNIHLEMSLNDFLDQTNRDDIIYDKDFYFRKQIEIKYENKPFTSIMYYFDLDNDQPLYELLIKYPEHFDLECYAKNKYGLKNYGNKWKISNAEGFFVLVWTY